MTRKKASSSSPIITTKECNRALQFLQNGNHSEALKLARSTVSRHPNSALAHTTLAAIHFSTAKSSKARKREHVTSAVHSAERAVSLSPNSISFSLFHAALLFELAQEDASSSSDYEPVIKECERALCIENPLDPLEDHLDIDENDPKDSTVELRIGRVKRNLKELLKKAKTQNLKKVVDISKKLKAIQDRKAEIQTKFNTAKESFERKINSKVNMRAKDYWNNVMSWEAKKELLNVGIEDLNSHFNKNKALAAKVKEVLAEAVECLKVTKNWKFSECCCCSERFYNWELNKEHVKSVHLGTLSEELQSVVPESIQLNSVYEIVIFDDWKPVDLVAAAKLMEDLPRNESGDLKTVVNWPYCGDTNRYIIINQIQTILQLYLAMEFFAISLFDMLMYTTREALENRIPKPVLEQHCRNKMLHLICFLEERELIIIREFLEQSLEISCGLRCLYSSFAVDEARGDLISSYERIAISDDFSRLVFDERMLHGQIIRENDGEENIEAIIHWLYAGSSTLFREKLKGWTSFREASKNQGMEYFRILQTEFNQLQKMCERKRDLLGYQKSWQNIMDICCEEKKRRDEILGYNPQNYKSLLLKRKKEIEVKKGDDEMDSCGLELDNISCILKKAEADSDKFVTMQIRQTTEKVWCQI
jgi:tetratricopeptide (TPR) repeat protein